MSVLPHSNVVVLNSKCSLSLGSLPFCLHVCVREQGLLAVGVIWFMGFKFARKFPFLGAADLSANWTNCARKVLVINSITLMECCQQHFTKKVLSALNFKVFRSHLFDAIPAKHPPPSSGLIKGSTTAKWWRDKNENCSKMPKQRRARGSNSFI